MSLSYAAWRNENKEILGTFQARKIHMLYTGGKDSSVILLFLSMAGKEFGFEFETSTALFPRQVFTDVDVHRLDKYWRAREVNVQWHSIDSSDAILEDAREASGNPCHACHQVKRGFLFQRLAEISQIHKDIVVILSFNLWDLVSYSIEYLLGGIFRSDDWVPAGNGKSAEQRFLETSQRFYPYITLRDGLSIYKPLLKYNDQDIRKVIEEEDIPVSTVECPYKYYTPKRTLFKYYDQFNIRFDYDKVVEFVKGTLKMNDLSYFENMGMIDFAKVL